jgi:NAD(P)-dependent dehydrogenase (short-subunit alcohol dehydrogenase family)
MNVTRAVLPVMRRQRSGHLFTIASMGGYLGGSRGTAYVQLVEQHHNSVLNDINANDIKAWRAKSSNTAFNAGWCSCVGFATCRTGGEHRVLPRRSEATETDNCVETV